MVAPTIATVLFASVALAAAEMAHSDCDVSLLRPFTGEPSGRQCAQDAGHRSPFGLLRAKPTETQVRAMCTSSACAALFNAMVDRHKVVDCTVPVGNKIRLHGDLVDFVVDRCPAMKHAYTLMDCKGAAGDSFSEFWYYADSSNVSYVPEDAERHTIVAPAAQTSAAAVWENNEVAVRKDSWAIVAYIDEGSGRSESGGGYAGLLEAGRGDLSLAYECFRGDDDVVVYRHSGALNHACRRRYICTSE